MTEKISEIPIPATTMQATDLFETSVPDGKGGYTTQKQTGQNISNGVANRAISLFVVDPTGATGYTAIQSALDAANAAGGAPVYLRPGTYTENLILYDKTLVVGTEPMETLANNMVSNVIIVGVHTPPTSGFFTFDSVLLQSATDIFNSSAAGGAILSILNCGIMLTDGYVFNLPNWAGALFADSVGESSTTSGFINNSTGTSSVSIHNSHIGSFGGGKTMQLGTLSTSNIVRSEIRCPVSAASGLNFYYCVTLDSITTLDGCSLLIYFSFLTKFGAPVINNNSSGGGGHIIQMSTFNGFNNPIIGGTGIDTLLIQGCTFFGSSTISTSFITVYKPWTVPFGGTGITSATANGIILAGAASDGAFQVADPGTLGQAFISNGASAPGSFQSINNIVWQTDTTTGIDLVANTGHIAAYGGVGALNYTLPLTASPGDTFIIVGGSINGWKVNQNASQLIHVGDYATTAGTSGTLASTTSSPYSCVILTCVVADTEFEAYGIQGTLKLDTINRQNSANAGFTATFNTPVGSAVSLTNGTVADVISGGFSLNPGLWLVLASVGITGDPTLSGTGSEGFIGTASGNSLTGRDLSLNTTAVPQVATVNSDVILTIPPQILSVSSTTTYYLKALASFSVGTAAAYGNVRVFKLGNF